MLAQIEQEMLEVLQSLVMELDVMSDDLIDTVFENLTKTAKVRGDDNVVGG